jgi:hypothetical protein
MDKFRQFLGCGDKKKHYILYEKVDDFIKKKLDIVHIL